MTTSRLRRLLPLFLVPAIGAPAAAVAAPDSLLDHVYRSRIGIQVQGMTPELREHFQAPADAGLLVTRVEAGRAGERGGVQVGDVVVAAGSERLDTPYDLLRNVAGVAAGETLELTVIRDGETRKLQVEPEGEPSPWIDPDYWRERLEDGVRHGSRQLRRRLRELERRLDELERRLERQPAPDDVGRTAL